MPSTDSPANAQDGKTEEPTAVVPVQDEVVSYQEADVARRAKIEKALAELDMSDSNSIIFFGTRAQEQLTLISDNMLEGVRNKDAGSAGGLLGDMLETLRGFDVESVDPNRKPDFFSRLFGGGNPVAKLLERYEEVRRQIDAITNKLEQHKTALLTDIASLDRLYDANLDYFHDLADYIAAGDEKLRQLDEEQIPGLAKATEVSGEVLRAQELRDLRMARDDLERRVHDLKLTRQVAMQGLPSIRLVQENDKSLVTKINSTMTNTVPLWRQQLAQAVTIYRSREAGETIKSATDLTNDLLTANSENLREANREVRQQVERGVFDIDVVKRANDNLIATIEESLQIADEGKRKRVEAEARLLDCETELRRTLAAARSKTESGETD